MSPGQPPQQQKEQHRVGQMKQQVGNMRTGRPLAEQVHVEHQRQPGQRMPVAGVPGGKCPGDIARRQTGQDVGLDVK